ncbi:MAG: glyceraldehyde-3-phosphate dehydrogenase [Acidobacteriota bacterium]|nr:glyceraldehyde-3-phosphate dehydrogenase [Acidobacteriota bacterium]
MVDYKEELQKWVENEKMALEAMSAIHQMWIDRSVELLMFRRVLVHQSTQSLLKSHQYASQISKLELTLVETLPIIRSLAKMTLCPSRIDLGRLAMEWLVDNKAEGDLDAFLKEKLTAHLDCSYVMEPRDVVLYGFGRIGRLMARILSEQAGGGSALRLRAVVCRGKIDVVKRGNLLRRDSVHGSLKGQMQILPEEDALIVNGCYIKFISADSPDQIDYEAYGITNALVIDNTGAWRDRAGLSKHLESKGVDRVLLTAPGKGDIPNIVYGVNTRNWQEGERIFSAASCTTNAIVPPIKVLNDNFGIQYAHVETVHSYTNDQNLLDNFHKKQRRGRSAPLNMVLTETGAASAISKALPELTGKVTGNAVRVPTPNVSLAILNLTFDREVTAEEVNESLRQASLKGGLVAQIDYTRDEDVVSTDLIGNTHPAIVDSLATQAHGNHSVVYVWYDNEYGYSMQVARLGRIVCGVERLRYY